MDLYVMRHGLAEPGHGKTDFERQLLPEGEAQVRYVAKHLRASRSNMPVERVLASPLLRTQQTARLVVEQLACPLQTCVLLEPDAGISELSRFLAQSPNQHLLLVSHMPLVSTLISYLINGDRSSYPDLLTAQVVHLQGEVCPAGMRQVQVLLPE